MPKVSGFHPHLQELLAAGVGLDVLQAEWGGGQEGGHTEHLRVEGEKVPPSGSQQILLRRGEEKGQGERAGKMSPRLGKGGRNESERVSSMPGNAGKGGFPRAEPWGR